MRTKAPQSRASVETAARTNSLVGSSGFALAGLAFAAGRGLVVSSSSSSVVEAARRNGSTDSLRRAIVVSNKN